jgi:hypothetical protein
MVSASWWTCFGFAEPSRRVPDRSSRSGGPAGNPLTSVTGPAKRATKEEDSHFVTALARGLDILGCYGPTNRWLANHEIAQGPHLPKPTVSLLA